MEIKNKKIDNGEAFDWGKASTDYARYRDIYPDIFYEKIINRGLCLKGQRVLDLGTGTGVLPRNMYRYGAEWTGIDISDMQIAQAKRMAAGLQQEIQYFNIGAEEIDFPDSSFDVATACQCFWYFDDRKLVPKLSRIIKEGGKLLLSYMAWLPFEDEIAGMSEALVLKYRPNWSGAGETMHPITAPEYVYEAFEAVYHEEYEIDVPFTRETWNGRMKACRGIGASLPREKVAEWENEHKLLLEKIAPEKFSIKHYAAMLELRRK